MEKARGSDTPTVRERVLPFQGNWHLPWVAQRYWRTGRRALTPHKLLNALLALAEMKAGRARVWSSPSVLRIEPTNVCNLRCPRCSCGINSDPRPKGFMRLDDFRLVLEQNHPSAAIVRLDGNGEPTLHPQIFEMIRMAKVLGYSVSMSANFNTTLCAEADGILDSGLDRLVVPLDGLTQESYERYRVGGNLALVTGRLEALLGARRRRGLSLPLVEVQFLDWGYNHEEIPALRALVRRWGADKLQVISPDWPVDHAVADPRRPRRCFWLWHVVTVDWQLNYRACTNAWTFPWPRLNLRNVPARELWNHEMMREARRFNVDKSSALIAADKGCNCNTCCDMLVVNRPPGYVCQ